MNTAIVIADYDADTEQWIGKVHAKVEGMVARIVIVKVGDKERPATGEDISAMAAAITAAAKAGDAQTFLNFMVTHHSVTCEIVNLT